MDSYIYEGTPESLGLVEQLHAKGVRILCPKCNSELLVALTIEVANQHKVHTGIYCLVDTNHVGEIIEIRRKRVDFTKPLASETSGKQP